MAEAIDSDTDAEVKIAPVYPNHPVRYDATRAYLGGASSFAQLNVSATLAAIEWSMTYKYCPPALGIALASSDKLTPTPIEMTAIMMMP